jgi:large subunit ribosomal protein L13
LKTFYPKKRDITHSWLLIDAQDKVLGNLASQTARLLMGKHKVAFTPGVDMGDFVIVVNSSKVAITGNKSFQKIYYKHTGYPGGIKSTNFEQMINRNPNYVIKNAIKGMLPKGPLGRTMLKKLKIYDGANHPHQSQNPSIFNFGN